MLCFTSFAQAQQYVDVINQTITLNSISSLMGANRNYIKVNMPEKTSAYIYRISITPKGTQGVSSNLFELVKNVAPADIAIGASLAQFVINSSDGSAVDSYTFNNPYDADNFVAKSDGNWTACQFSRSVVNNCYSAKQCLNPTMYFGFKNNNMVQGLDVHLEIVALVDSTKQNRYSYSYTILNGANQEVKYMISYDNLNWETVNLRSAYSYTLTKDQPVIHFKIYTTAFNYVAYDLQPNERYKIIWSTKNKWDLIRY